MGDSLSHLDNLLLPTGSSSPNTEAFFKGFVALLQQCGLCCQENSDGGLAEFLARRLEEYQRTLRVMYG